MVTNVNPCPCPWFLTGTLLFRTLIAVVSSPPWTQSFLPRMALIFGSLKISISIPDLLTVLGHGLDATCCSLFGGFLYWFVVRCFRYLHRFLTYKGLAFSSAALIPLHLAVYEVRPISTLCCSVTFFWTFQAAFFPVRSSGLFLIVC